MALIKQERKEFVSILGSDATLRMTVPEGTEGSIVREYETSTGAKGKKSELVFNKIVGKITDISFYEGDFGKLIQLDITDNDGTLTLSVSTAQNFGEDIMKKIPNIDLTKTIELSPYSFEDEKGKVRKGVSIVQEGKKIKNFFYDEVTKKNINGYPDIEGDKNSYDKDDWKIYFMKARKFLVSYIEEKYPTKNIPKPITAGEIEYPTDEITPNDIPF